MTSIYDRAVRLLQPTTGEMVDGYPLRHCCANCGHVACGIVRSVPEPVLRWYAGEDAADPVQTVGCDSPVTDQSVLPALTRLLMVAETLDEAEMTNDAEVLVEVHRELTAELHELDAENEMLQRQVDELRTQ